MMTEPLPDQYTRALAEYLSQADEGTLLLAYDLGRRAMGAGLGVIEVVAMHHESLGRCLDGLGTPEDAARAARAAGGLLAESLAPFEMVYRGQAEANAALRESQARLQAILDNTTAVISLKDLDGRYLLINKQFSQVFGFPPHEALGATDHDLFPAETADAYVEHDRQVLESGAPQEFEEVAPQRDGPHTYLSIKFMLRDATGAPTAVGAIATDITERRRSAVELATAHAQAIDASRLKSEFLATMSHEIRTPMNGVIGMTALLLDTDLTHEQRSFAETIRGSGEALLAVINDILDFSKIEAGKLDIEVTDFDLRSVIENAVWLLAARAHDKGLELVTFVPPGVPTGVRGDPGRVRQVLTNLVGNAIKFTETGEVVVRAAVAEESSRAAVIRFEVTDTGIGISPGDQQRLFTAFSQADPSTTRRYGGTGLGLSISKRLAELMGGQIGVASDVGQGSTFWFTVRLERWAAGCVTGGGPDLAGLRVLVVDDNATCRSILAQSLLLQGARVTTADRATEALALLRAAAAAEEVFSVALVDHGMPGTDGMDLGRAIIEDPALAGTRLVLLTSSAHHGAGRRARQAGFSASLTKPVRQAELFDCLAAVTGPAGHESSAPSVTDPRATATKARPGHILVVEDNVVNQKVAVLMLGRMGYRVDVANNGAEALDAVSRSDYAAVLMDCQMPEMDGYEATRRIRQLDSPRGQVPIIALTAGAMKGDEERCLAAGMDDYATKPLKLDLLAVVLDRWITRSRP